MSNIARDTEAYLASVSVSKILLEVMGKAYNAGVEGQHPKDFLAEHQEWVDALGMSIVEICGEVFLNYAEEMLEAKTIQNMFEGDDE